ncbi:hypothetical protein RRF57_000968 [Xylaria bambusicola]|uniref:Heterokaryon incompatibility domain-containing protein n=1 Tax=Xylaria bambusicola TaxID=326684 RepID=A0AAN7Z176_9PEZI
MSPGIQQFLAWNQNQDVNKRLSSKRTPGPPPAASYLLSRRWFRRLWVLQEMCIPKDLVFWFREHQLTEQDLMAALDVVKSGLRDAT